MLKLFDNMVNPMLTWIADMGPILPLLSSTPPEHHAKIDHATQVLLALERRFAQKPASH